MMGVFVWAMFGACVIGAYRDAWRMMFADNDEQFLRHFVTFMPFAVGIILSVILMLAP